jgi:NAD-dependent dihydropyrimidine dehydrogenase PreA subunit
MTPPRRVLLCRCAHTALVPPAVWDAARRRLDASGIAVEVVPDLCALAARKDPLLRRFADGGPCAVVACAPRAVRWLFHVAGAPLPPDGVTLLSLREPGALSRIDAGLLAREPAPPPREAAGAETPGAVPADADGAWYPWFPVIDFDRCNHCRQCLSFCLFGVYDAPGGKVEVARPEACKADCPACARVCPVEAIVFPKFPHPPVSGAPGGTAADAVSKVDLSALLGGDVHARLRERNAGAKRRFSVE